MSQPSLQEPTDRSGQRNYTYIKTPSYITCALQNALEQSWHLTSVFRREEVGSPLAQVYKEDVSHIHGLPDSYRDLVHIGPVLCAKPTTFFNFLVQASIEQLACSLKAHQEDQQNSPRIPNGDSSEDVFRRFSRTGWKEIIWTFEGLLSTLKYWGWLGSKTENARYWSAEWILPKDAVNLIEDICRQYKAQLDEVDAAMRRRDGTQAKSVSELLRNRLSQEALFPAESGMDVMMTDETNAARRMIQEKVYAEGRLPVRELYLMPESWHGLADSVVEDIRGFWTAPSTLPSVLSDNFAVLEIVCQVQSPQTIIRETLQAMSSSDISNAIQDDPQTALTNYGSLVFLILAVCNRYNIPTPSQIGVTATTRLVQDLSEEESSWLNDWIQAIFGSAGISDELLQSTRPEMLLQLAPTLVSQAISAAVSQIISIETLHSGLSFFSQPLLGWCQAGIIDWLCVEVQRQGLFASTLLDVLQLLVVPEDLPRCILETASDSILKLFEPGLGLDLVLSSSSVNQQKLHSKAAHAHELLGRPASRSHERDWELLLRSRLDGIVGDLATTSQQAAKSLGYTKWMRCLIEGLHAELDGDKCLIVLMYGSGFPSHFVQPLELRALSRAAPSVDRKHIKDFVAKCVTLLARICQGPQDEERHQPSEKILQEPLSKVLSSRMKWEIEIERRLQRPRYRLTRV